MKCHLKIDQFFAIIVGTVIVLAIYSVGAYNGIVSRLKTIDTHQQKIIQLYQTRKTIIQEIEDIAGVSITSDTTINDTADEALTEKPLFDAHVETQLSQIIPQLESSDQQLSGKQPQSSSIPDLIHQLQRRYLLLSLVLLNKARINLISIV